MILSYSHSRENKRLTKVIHIVSSEVFQDKETKDTAGQRNLLFLKILIFIRFFLLPTKRVVEDHSR